MTHISYLAMKKLTGSAHLTVASRHNLRELGTSHGPHIDLRLSDSNMVLRGPDTADAVATMAKSLMDEAGVLTLRRDAVRALEIIFTLPASSGIDARGFFEHAVGWADRYFGVPTLSAVVHLDEGAPHCHVLLLPLLGGSMVGSRLMGGPSKLRAMQEAFHDQVGRQYGLVRKAPERRLSAAYRRHAADTVVDTLQADLTRLSEPEVMAALRALVGTNPERMLQVLGLDVQMPKAKPKGRPATSFVAQMTKVMKPDKPKHIGFASAADPEQTEAYPCVGFQLEPASLQAEERRHADADRMLATIESVRRVRDDEAGPGYWCEVRGEWVNLPAKSSRKMDAAHAVRQMLAASGMQQPTGRTA